MIVDAGGSIEGAKFGHRGPDCRIRVGWIDLHARVCNSPSPENVYLGTVRTEWVSG